MILMVFKHGNQKQSWIIPDYSYDFVIILSKHSWWQLDLLRSIVDDDNVIIRLDVLADDQRWSW